MQTAQLPPRDYAARPRIVSGVMSELAARLNAPGGGFECVRPARWRHWATGHHVETGYSYGEGRVRVFLDGGRAVDVDIAIFGRDGDLDKFHELFPVSG